jgi:hypothetical protein
VACSGCATGFTGAPNTVSHNGAAVHGSVISDTGGEVEYWVQYGPTKAYGSVTPHATLTAQQNVAAPVQVTLSGLARSTSYHYRLCAQDSQQGGNPGCGEDRTVKTQSFACGDTVTANVRLTGNVQCPDRFTSAIVVGASNIDINLNGFELRGQTLPGDGGGGTYAIRNPGFDDVKVHDGGTVNWVGGVQVLEAERNLLVRLRGRPIQLFGGGVHEVRHNDLSGEFSAVSVDESTGVVVADNRLHSPGRVVSFDLSDGARVVRNQVTGEQACCDGIGIDIGESDSQVRDNRVSTIDGIGIRILSGANHVVTGNLVTNIHRNDPDPSADPDLDGDGIVVDTGTPTGALRDNTTNNNGGDGIDVNVSGLRLGRNHADFNGLFGIDAAIGTIDEGGNTATGNGNPMQCRNVFCQ